MTAGQVRVTRSCAVAEATGTAGAAGAGAAAPGVKVLNPVAVLPASSKAANLSTVCAVIGMGAVYSFAVSDGMSPVTAGKPSVVK